MGHLMFYLAVVASCLLWSAACVAAAVRTQRPRLRTLLVAAAVLAPPLALVPWVGLTGMLAFAARLETNWFGPTLTAFLAAVVGGLWIVRAGLSQSGSGRGPVAAAWPAVGLFAMFVMAKAVSFGTLLFIDNAVAAEARGLRVEAAQMMQANLPPMPAADDDAAPLYLRVFAALDADTSFAAEESPVNKTFTVDVRTPEVTAVLARHAASLDLLRRAADRPTCRFTRDWTRPSISLLLPEVQSLRNAARLLSLAARREAADGDPAAAIRDIVRVHRIGMQAASEPILICGLVGQAIDTMALNALADVLPRLVPADLPLLESPAIADLVGTPFVYQRHFLGEEAFGLATLADLADARQDLSILQLLEISGPRKSSSPFFGQAVTFLFRCFLLPADLAAYRDIMGRFQNLATSSSGATPSTFGETSKRTAEIHAEFVRRRGIVSGMLTPALGSVLTTQTRSRALHRAAEVLVAATRARLAGGSLPESLDALVPGSLAAVPLDPFTAGKPLLAKRGDGFWTVYSVGADGEDDGGPVPDPLPAVEGNDDQGLRLAL
jgi:hypothetical protein